MRKRTWVAGILAAVAVTALLCSGDGPTHPAKRRAPHRETGRREIRQPLAEGVVPIRVILPVDAWNLVPQCPPRREGWSPYHALWVDRSALDLPGKWAVGFQFDVPPRLVRNALRGSGVRPATLAKPLGVFSPWASYAALRIERDWFQADLEDASPRLQAEIIRRFGDPPDYEDPVVNAFVFQAITEISLPDDAHRALADRVTRNGGMPGSLAIADEFEGRYRPGLGDSASPELYLEVLTGEGWADHARSSVASVLCSQVPIELSADQESALARQIPAYGDRELAVAAAMVGLNASMAAQRPEAATTFRALLDDALDSCHEWGEYGDLAGKFAPFDQLPPELRPDGFNERAALLGERLTDVATVAADCTRLPCMATVTWLPGVEWVRVDTIAQELWPGFRLANRQNRVDGAPPTSWLVPVAGHWSHHQLGRIGDWRAQAGSFECLADYQVRALRAQLGDTPTDWQGALSTAAYSCHREDPLTDTLGSPGRWDGERWHLGGTSPFLRCVEARFEGPAPPDAAAIYLTLLVQ